MFETVVVPVASLVIAFIVSALDMHVEIVEVAGVSTGKVTQEMNIENPLNRDSDGGGDDNEDGGSGGGDREDTT